MELCKRQTEPQPAKMKLSRKRLISGPMVNGTFLLFFLVYEALLQSRFCRYSQNLHTQCI